MPLLQLYTRKSDFLGKNLANRGGGRPLPLSPLESAAVDVRVQACLT